MNNKGSISIITLTFLLLAISLIAGCSKIKEQTENTTSILEACEEEKKGFETLYKSEQKKRNITNTITIYKNITQNCTAEINESKLNNSYVLKLIQQKRYFENLAEECHFYNESERNENLTKDLEVCEKKIEDIGDLI